MSTHLYLAPAAAGKSTYILDLARTTAQDLAGEARVIVASHLQVRAARRRLAEMGGAIGVHILTFDRLGEEVLDAAGEVYTTLSDPVQYRLLRALLGYLLLAEEGPGVGFLRHYAPIADRPGFAQVLQRLIAELKAACVHPDRFARAIRAMGGEPRLAELAQIYAAYQARLGAQGWADRAGMTWLAAEVLRERAAHVARDWPLLAVDGFDSFTPAQVALLGALARRVGDMVITLTGDPRGDRRLVHRRFSQTRDALEAALSLHAEPLPPPPDLTGLPRPVRSPALAHLERALFHPAEPRIEGAGQVELIEAPDRPAEVRAALRWLKARLRLDGYRPGEVALLARHFTSYRPFIQQIAAEFGLPIRLSAGLPLRENPVVSELLSLLQSMQSDGAGDPVLPRRAVVEAWRSPYFDWSALRVERAPHPSGIRPGDADDLDALARWGRVISGLAQWREAFDRLAALAVEPAEEEDRGRPAGLSLGEAARTLGAKFESFVEKLRPPSGLRSYRDFVGWLESLIGEDAPPSPFERGVGGEARPVEDSSSLRMVVCARAAGDPAIAERDLAALVALKDALRGLVWVEGALQTPAVDFTGFMAELSGAVNVATYNLPAPIDREEILVADIVPARGVPFRAVAVLGLAEGEFPASLSEDPFLRDADRRRLRDEFHLPLQLSTERVEAGFFYDTVTQPCERLLLTRPRLADNGALWQASPYWEEVRRLVAAEPAHLTSESAPLPGEVASWPELLESLAAYDGYSAILAWAQGEEPERTGGVAAAAQVLRKRRPGAGANPFEGDLGALAGAFAARFSPDRAWSASRLETYRSCPFAFFVTYVLGLEPRQEPVEGLDARQLGNIYHRILDRVYGAVSDPADLDELLAALPAVAGSVLDDAPRAEGFRATAWWAQTRVEIEANAERSVKALAALPGEYVPVAREAGFRGAKAPTLTGGGDAFRLNGFIDRVDRSPGGALRIIDYKTAGPASFNEKAVVDGKKLQLALYALAAEQVLGLGRIADGFYWHVQHAEPSKFTLSDFAGGPEEAIKVALAHAWSAVLGAREGRFIPRPPDDGCPDYCPAAGFCWRFRPRRG